jgi:hypothetical protein
MHASPGHEYAFIHMSLIPDTSDLPSHASSGNKNAQEVPITGAWLPSYLVLHIESSLIYVQKTR